MVEYRLRCKKCGVCLNLSNHGGIHDKGLPYCKECAKSKTKNIIFDEDNNKDGYYGHRPL